MLGDSSPNTYQVDLNIDRESLLESSALSPTRLVVMGIHFVREWDLLMIALWKQPNLRENDYQG
jgi:hypothetical protein